MKVLFVIGSLRVGGTETQLVMLVKGLTREGVHCRVFSMEGEGPLAPELCAIGVGIIDGGYRKNVHRLWRMLTLLRVAYRLHRDIQRHPCEIVHAFLPEANFIATIVAGFRRVPRVYTSKRALGTHRARHRLWPFLDYLANRLSHRVVVNSMGVWEDVADEPGLDPRKLRLIHNGIDSNRFRDAGEQRDQTRDALDLDATQLIVALLANLIPYKGHSDALQALAIVRQSGISITLLMIGDDRGQQKRLEREAERLGVAAQVRWLGRRDDVPALLSAADIGLLASHEEGFSNALLEMMAAGLPVVATNVGGNPEALENGALGLLVEPRQPQQMADALATLARNPELRRLLGKMAAARVQERYSPDVMVGCYLDAYNQSSRGAMGRQ